MTNENAAKVREIATRRGFQEESFEDDQLHFATRENGDVCECVHGHEDLLAGRALRKEIQTAIPGATVVVDVCDEWVTISVGAP